MISKLISQQCPQMGFSSPGKKREVFSRFHQRYYYFLCLSLALAICGCNGEWDAEGFTMEFDIVESSYLLSDYNYFLKPNDVITHHNAAGGDRGDYGSAIAIDSQGRLVIVGESWNGGTGINASDIVIWRYTNDGFLDPTFGGTGYVVEQGLSPDDGHDDGIDVAIDSFGRILVLGHDNSNGVVLYRYNTDGSRDTTFNGDGLLLPGGEYCRGICLDSNGNILVTGNIGGSDIDLLVMRFNDDGSPDLSFGIGGTVIQDRQGGGGAGDDSSDSGNDITVDPSGRIIVCGSTRLPSEDSDATLWRFFDNGDLDTSFNGNGIVIHHNAAGGNGYDSCKEVVVGAKGKIYAVGISDGGKDDDMAVWSFNNDGTLNILFSNNGVVCFNRIAGCTGNASDEYGASIDLDSAGRIIITGRAASKDVCDVVIVRLLTTGSLDGTFGTNGVVQYNSGFGTSFDSSYSVRVAPDGKVWATGSTPTEFNYDMVLLRFDPSRNYER